VELSTLSCGDHVSKRSALVVRDTRDDCGAVCTVSCTNSAGGLPPISEDCEQIVNAVTIYSGLISDDFVVSPFSLAQLTFGTCRYFFENLSSDNATYCWSSFASQASQAGTTCFPPNQPVRSEGDCTSTDGTFIVGYVPL
ncbi:hypothetical protein K488DRAFT_6398, partial [Vararia minispora EC-137]